MDSPWYEGKTGIEVDKYNLYLKCPSSLSWCNYQNFHFSVFSKFGFYLICKAVKNKFWSSWVKVTYRFWWKFRKHLYMWSSEHKLGTTSPETLTTDLQVKTVFFPSLYKCLHKNKSLDCLLKIFPPMMDKQKSYGQVEVFNFLVKTRTVLIESR